MNSKRTVKSISRCLLGSLLGLLLAGAGGCVVSTPIPGGTERGVSGSEPTQSLDVLPDEAEPADGPTSVSDLRNDPELNQDGKWIAVEGTQCWQPSDVAPDWKPYTEGNWAQSDAGLTWRSTEAWATTYHYGNWVSTASNGWVWVPGITWSPAWVVWREGGGYIGWGANASQ